MIWEIHPFCDLVELPRISAREYRALILYIDWKDLLLHLVSLQTCPISPEYHSRWKSQLRDTSIFSGTELLKIQGARFCSKIK